MKWIHNNNSVQPPTADSVWSTEALSTEDSFDSTSTRGANSNRYDTIFYTSETWCFVDNTGVVNYYDLNQDAWIPVPGASSPGKPRLGTYYSRNRIFINTLQSSNGAYLNRALYSDDMGKTWTALSLNGGNVEIWGVDDGRVFVLTNVEYNGTGYASYTTTYSTSTDNGLTFTTGGKIPKTSMDSAGFPFPVNHSAYPEQVFPIGKFYWDGTGWYGRSASSWKSGRLLYRTNRAGTTPTAWSALAAPADLTIGSNTYKFSSGGAWLDPITKAVLHTGTFVLATDYSNPDYGHLYRYVLGSESAIKEVVAPSTYPNAFNNPSILNFNNSKIVTSGVGAGIGISTDAGATFTFKGTAMRAAFNALGPAR